jgi:protein-S-isoprenylcysteine O-methyltransferase Ste14
MYFFIILLILGFGSNLASTFTAFYSERWGKHTGTFITILLRDIFGIPVWAGGFLLAIKGSNNLLFSSSVLSLAAAWSLMIAGAAIIIAALISIRLKAAAPSVGDQLVSTGIYSIVRHPVHCGTFLEFLGLFLFWPSINLVLCCIIGTIWIILQSIFEEIDLLRRIPGYRDYLSQVPAFIPFLRNAKKL